jgi:hypothetical protein
MTTRLAVIIVALAALTLSARPSDAGMGLRCSEWINARKWVRYDPQTNRYIAVTPPPGTAKPVPPKVDNDSGFVSAYVGGIIDTFTWLDPTLKKMADIPGIEMPPKLTLPAVLDRVEELCKGGLREDRKDYDVLDIVSMNNQGNVMLRAMVMQDLLQKFMDAGARQSAAR